MTLLISNAPFGFDPAKDCRTVGSEIDQTYRTFETKWPSMRSVVARLLPPLVADPPLEIRQAIFALADHAEQSGTSNAYHNPLYTLQVTANIAFLLQLNQHRAVEDRPGVTLFDDRDILCGLMAALGHDLDHDGGTNRDAQGVRHPFRLERIAAWRATSIMAQCDVGWDMQRDVFAMIHATDIGEPNGIRRIATGLPLPVPLQPLAENPQLLGMAQILCDADLLSSAGLSTESLLQGNARLGREWGKTLGIEHGIGLLENVMQNSFQSEAGKWFNPNMVRIRRDLEQALKAPAPVTAQFRPF